EGDPLTGFLAIYPTVNGLQSFANTMGITMEVTDNSFETIRKLLLSIDFKSLFCDEILYHKLQSVHEERTTVNNNTTTIIQQKYMEKKIHTRGTTYTHCSFRRITSVWIGCSPVRRIYFI
ncbi:MAG: hypothetical protein ACKPKO_42100, partial [Candidatus Fonsibacter sp.]